MYKIFRSDKYTLEPRCGEVQWEGYHPSVFAKGLDKWNSS